jgi:Flp pilus assembly protein TadD/serine/threonine protein kinase
VENLNPKIDDIFLAALERESADERSAYLDEACAGNSDLRRRVERLLEAQIKNDSFLEAPAPEFQPTVDQQITEAAGTVMGPYKLLEQVGEGGMGTVWMAQQQEPIKRVVALKLIKAGMDSRQVIARFEAERQALALMEHPNIARVLDGGTTDAGRPYFVMDLVKGVPITRYCDEHHLTPRQRLELFIPVCQAVQHAHQKGIIHRDLKPSNVLVALYDGKPVPKVIDFGVAKAAGQSLTDKTLVTGFGNIVGTLEYMSPEQAEINQLDIDTRSDIYSLGVLLYELLTGSPPFTKKDLEKAGMLEMLRVIREKEPSKPSTKLSTAKGLPTLAANRSTEPTKLTKLVRGELDWIVMKALEKDRARRYETANGFAADVQRYLADEQVLACPPSVGYRLRKFVRRNKAGLRMAAAVGLVLLLAVACVGWLVRDRAAREEEIARERTTQEESLEREVERTVQDAERLQDQKSWTEALSAVKRAEALLAGGGSDEIGARVRELRKDLEMALRLEEIRVPRIAAGLASRAQGLGEPLWEAVVDNDSENLAYAAAFRAYDIDMDSLDPADAAARIRARPIRAELTAALDRWIHKRRNSTLAGTSLSWQRLLAVAREADPDPWRSRVRDAVKHGRRDRLNQLANSPDIASQPLQTLSLLGGNCETEQALAVLRLGQQKYPDDFEINFQLAWALDHGPQPPPLDEVIRFYTAARALRPRHYRLNLILASKLGDHGRLDEAIALYRNAVVLKPDDTIAHNNLGGALEMLGRLDEAIAQFRKAIELDSKNAAAHNNLGSALQAKGLLDEAIVECRKAIERDPKLASPHNNLGQALRAKGRLDEAIACYRNAIELNPKSVAARNNLGYALQGKGQMDEAIEECRKAIELDPKESSLHNTLGLALKAKGRLDEAIACYRKAIELNPKNAKAHNNLGNALQAKGRLDEAIDECRKAIDLDSKNAAAHNNLGLALKAKGRLDEAIACYSKAIELDPKNAIVHNNLGWALQAKGPLDEAITEFQKAIDLDPKCAHAHHGLGLTLQRKRRLNEAITEYRKAIELDPKNAIVHGNLAWLLATCPDGKFRDPPQAVELAQKAVELQPKNHIYWRTLGVARYRAGEWKAAIAALHKMKEIGSPGDSRDWFLLAMAHWQLGDKNGARGWYDKAVGWMEKNRPNNEELRRHLGGLRAETEALIGVNK